MELWMKGERKNINIFKRNVMPDKESLKFGDQDWVKIGPPYEVEEF